MTGPSYTVKNIEAIAEGFVRHASEINETGAAETVCALGVCRETSQYGYPVMVATTTRRSSSATTS